MVDWRQRVLGGIWPWLRFLCLLILLAPCIKGAEIKKIPVAVYPGNPPYEYATPDGQPAGFTVDVLKALAEAEGLEFEIRLTPYIEFIPALESGRVDLLTGVVWSEDRARIVDYTSPFQDFPLIILAREGAGDVRSEADLKDKKTLVLGRSIITTYCETHGLPYIAVGSQEEAIWALKAGKGDCAIVPKYSWLYHAKNHGGQGVKLVPGDFYPTKRNFAVRKGNSALLKKINDGLFRIQGNGTLQKLHDRHFGALEASEMPLRKALLRVLPVMLPMALCLILLVLFAWVFFLRRKVRGRTVELQRTVENLQAALIEVHHLSGLIPICAHCKKVRDDQGYWQAVEGYIAKRTEATFSHSMCPDCARQYYPEMHQDS